MIDRNYLARHAATLLKLARLTADRAAAAALIDKATELKDRIDECHFPDVTPLAPDIVPRPANWSGLKGPQPIPFIKRGVSTALGGAAGGAFF